MNIQKVFTAEMPDTMTGHIITDFNTEVSDPDVNVASYGLSKQLNDNLSGFKFYPIGTQLVAYIEGHGWYNTDGKYVIWGTATANALVEASPNTYYGRPSEEDCRGEVGADTGIPFSKKLVLKNLKVYSGYGNIGANGTSCQYYLELDVSSYNLLKIKNLTNSTANAKCGLTLTDIDTSTTIYSKVNQAVTNFSTDVDISSVNNLQIQLSCYMRYEYSGERSQIDELDFL